ncbi:MAG: hypothetical protein DME25_12645 [Verrucomicrobia bacterium]|nr:MAG: hypothetical protein DME25_12645 [Verrucomicrobiota bacterium]
MRTVFMNKTLAAPIPPAAWIVLLVAACLVPFVNKAFHIDDPLFLWTAEHIRIAPGDFYNFRVNWHGLEMPMTDAECNPPLMGFLLALASLVVGWGEVPLHLVAMLPAIAVALGTFRLAQSYSPRPLLAAAVLVLTPGFLVCSSSVMCDVTMLAFWVWAIVFWERGLATHRLADFVWAGVLAGLCGLTKYSGLSVVPLLLAYALARHWQAKRSPAGTPALPGRWALALLIPIAMLGVYEWMAYRRYGVVLLENATAYAREVRTGTLAGLPERVVSGLVFAGGCGLPALLLAPCLWSRRALGIGVVLFAGINGAALRHGWISFASNWPLELQRALFLLGGISIVALALGDLRKHRDAVSVLLGLWVGGVLVFATVFNWTLNGRTVLPMLPAVGLLIGRRLQSRKWDGGQTGTRSAGRWVWAGSTRGSRCGCGGLSAGQHGTRGGPTAGQEVSGATESPRVSRSLGLSILYAEKRAAAAGRLERGGVARRPGSHSSIRHSRAAT